MRAFLVTLFAALCLAVFATTPPRPQPRSAPATAFSAARAMEDVRRLAAAPHPAGSAENEAVRGYLSQRMTALGMTVTARTAPISADGVERLNAWSGRSDSGVTLTNLIGVLPGQDRSLPAVLLMAHHDTVWGSPGAADDSAGVAASLEIVRAVAAAGQPKRDLMILLTDGEELGMEGAKQFFAADPLRGRIGAIINLEARGGGGRTSLFQTSRDNGAAAALYAAAVARPVASSLSAFVYSVLPNNTDLTPALTGPYTAYNFAFIGRPGLYHSPLATPARLDQGSVQDMGAQVLDLTAALLGAGALPAKAPDAVFFDVFGLFTAIWPAWLGWPMLAAAVGALAVAVRRGGRSGLGRGAAQMTALIAGSAAALYGFNALSALGGHSEYYDRLAAIPRLEVQAALVCAAAFVGAFGAWRGGTGSAVGAALPLAVLGIGLQAAAPTAAYVVIVPVLLSAAVLAWPNRWMQVGVAALVTGYMIALGHFLMQGVGPDTPMAVALPLALGVLPLVPLWPGLAKGAVKPALAALLIGAGGIALWVLLDAPAATQAVYAKA